MGLYRPWDCIVLRFGYGFLKYNTKRTSQKIKDKIYLKAKTFVGGNDSTNFRTLALGRLKLKDRKLKARQVLVRSKKERKGRVRCKDPLLFFHKYKAPFIRQSECSSNWKQVIPSNHDHSPLFTWDAPDRASQWWVVGNC